MHNHKSMKKSNTLDRNTYVIYADRRKLDKYILNMQFQSYTCNMCVRKIERQIKNPIQGFPQNTDSVSV